MTHYVAAEWTWLQIGVVFVFGLLMRLSAADTSDLEKMLAAAVLEALTLAHLKVKDAAYYMRLNEAQLARQLRGEPQQYLSLTRLIRLPFSFWLAFGPSLMAIVWKKRMSELAECAEQMKRRA